MNKRTSTRKTRSVVPVLLTASLILVASGCTNGSEQTGPVTSATPASSPGNSPAASGNIYPIKTDVELTRFYTIPAGPQLAVAPDAKNWPFMQGKAKLTGVKEKLVIPAANQAKEQLNIMFASGDYTDIIEWNFLQDYPGGPEKAIKDGNILPLNDLIDKYAPNLKKYLKAHPEVDKQLKTDSGTYYGFPWLNGDDILKTYAGPMLRKDWLDELGLAVPTTIDEWHTVLKAFKEKKGAAAPLTFGNVPRLFQELSLGGAFIGAFGVNLDFYMDQGKVKFGPLEPGFKEFLTTFRQWYAEGLIDKDIATVDNSIVRANMMSGKSGATYMLLSSGMGLFMDTMKKTDPKYNVVGAPYPVLKKGDKPMFGQKDYDAPRGGNFAVSAKSKHPELAVQLLDWGYGEAGAMYYNFGDEGVTYTMVNGYPTFTDLTKKDSVLSRGGYYQMINGATIYDKRHYEQFISYPQQKEALALWTDTDVDKHKLPPISPTAQESSEFAKIMNEVNTYVNEMAIKYMLGTESLASYDQFQKKLKSLNIDRAIELEQAALERYNKR